MDIYIDFVIDTTSSAFNIVPAVYLFCDNFMNQLFDEHSRLGNYKIYFGVTAFYGPEEKMYECQFGEEKKAFTTNKIYFRQGFQKIEVGGGDPFGKDNIMGGIEYSSKKLEKEKGLKAMIVFSDSYVEDQFRVWENFSLQYVRLFLPHKKCWQDISINHNIFWALPLKNRSGRVDHRLSTVVCNLENICDENTMKDELDRMTRDFIYAIRGRR